MRRCVSGVEARNIMWHCHSSDCGGPFDCWDIDFMGPFPPSDNKLYIL
ncbi:hypothetical protein A2U01_0105061, partial [Trifolium medium]|nr:hypothetical protein [Trifolium medium]